MTEATEAPAAQPPMYVTPPDAVVTDTPEPTEAADNPEGAPEAGEGEAEAEATQQRIDLGELGQHLVTVKVNGEEFDVPLDEAVKGFMRQDAFTRKTQAVAEQAKRLQHVEALADQLDRDPQGLIQRLAQHFEVRLGATEDGEYEEPDPVQQKLADIERQLHEQRMAEASAQIDNEIRELQATYGEFDVDELIQFTTSRGLPSLTDAYAVMNFGPLHEKRQTTNQITDAKRSAQVVSGAGSTQKGAVGKPTEFKDARAAIVAAMREGNYPGV